MFKTSLYFHWHIKSFALSRQPTNIYFYSGILEYTLPLHNENNLKTMEIHFDKEYLQQLYEEGKTKDKKHRFQPQMVKRYQ